MTKKIKDSSKNRRTDTINKNLVSSKEGVLVVLRKNSYYKLFSSLLPSVLDDSFREKLCSWLDEEYGLLAVVLRDLQRLSFLSVLQARTLVLHQFFAVPQVTLAYCLERCDPSNISRALAQAALKLVVGERLKDLMFYVYSEPFVGLKKKFEVFVRQERKEEEIK